jgi:hypothetical protein
MSPTASSPKGEQPTLSEYRQLEQSITLSPLRAITVNPVAPQSHRLDSAQLRAMLRAAIADVAIFDVLDPG